MTAAAILGAGRGGVAVAQQGGGPGGGPCAGMMMGMHQGEMMGMGPMLGGPGQHVAGSLAFLEAELAITPTQEAAWASYARAVEASSTSMREMHDKMMTLGATPPPPPERLSTRDEMMSARLDSMKRLTAAVEPLYAALSPRQKAVADRLLGGM